MQNAYLLTADSKNYNGALVVWHTAQIIGQNFYQHLNIFNIYIQNKAAGWINMISQQEVGHNSMYFLTVDSMSKVSIYESYLAKKQASWVDYQRAMH